MPVGGMRVKLEQARDSCMVRAVFFALLRDATVNIRQRQVWDRRWKDAVRGALLCDKQLDGEQGNARP